MKKLISLMLSVVLVFSLCAPAVAVEDLDPPLYEQYGYSSADEMIAEWGITLEEYYAMAEEQRFLENWKYDPATGDMSPAIWEHEGYASKEEYLEANSMTAEEYDDMVVSYCVSYDWNYDEATGDFLPPLWRGYGFESLEAMLDEWGMTEEDYYEMVEDERLWKEQESWTEEDWDKYYEEQREIEKDALGLTYDINVMFRNDPFMFTDAVPEIVNDRVMVPLRAVMENMGAEVNYDDATRTAVITREDTELTFVLGSDRFAIKTGDETREIVLDSVPYIKHDRVFVPIRFVAESLGYDVYWSEDYRTGVYFDREEIVAELNENYSIANGVLAMGRDVDMTKNYKGDVNMAVKFTANDGEYRGKTFSVGLDAVVVQNQTSAKMTMEFDIASIMDLINDALGEDEEMTPADTQLITEILESVDKDSIDMIIDLNKGIYYMRGGLFAILGRELGIDMGEDTWVEMDLSSLTGVDFSEIMAMAQDMSSKLTVGDYIYMMCTSGENEYVYAYDAMRVTAGFADLVADSQFTKSGSSYKYSLDLADLIGFGDDTLKLGLNVTMNGGVANRVKGSFDFVTDEATADIDLDMTAMQAKITGTVNVKGSFKVQFTVSSTVKETNETVPTGPAAGDKIISFEELADIA